MKRLRILGLSLLALFALGAVAASVASAEQKEGMLPLANGTLLLKGEKPKAVLATASTELPAIECTELKGSTKAETDTHGTGTLDFLGCSALGFPAFSLGDAVPKEVKEALILLPVLYLICLIEPKKLVFGLFVEIKEPLHIDILSLASLVIVEGAVIGELTPNTASKLLTFKFVGASGVQTVKECFDENGGAKKGTLKISHPKVANASELAEGLIQFTQAVELMDKI